MHELLPSSLPSGQLHSSFMILLTLLQQNRTYGSDARHSKALPLTKGLRARCDQEGQHEKCSWCSQVAGLFSWCLYVYIYIYILRLPTRATGRHGMSHESDYACATQQALVIALFWS